MAGKPRTRRNKQTLELEAPWSNIRAQWESRPPHEQQAAERRARQLIQGGWGAVTWSDLLGER